ncbi:MAG: DUF1992 domain-containing protein [Anaerolineales bacterium]|nr:DUF1992 domain-containing protein [Anaerolineales bacterium]
MDFDRVIEEQLRKAREAGKFDNLRGHGQPLRLAENPFEDPSWQLANEMLKKNGFRPEWLEEDVALRDQLEQARAALLRSREWQAAELRALAGRSDARAIEQRCQVEQEWQLAQARFRMRLTALNKVIFDLNLKVPSTRLQRHKLDVDAELRKLL